jgi:hypothetical protein
MAPQVIEIAKNGLGDPPARGESARRIPCQMKKPMAHETNSASQDRSAYLNAGAVGEKKVV